MQTMQKMRPSEFRLKCKRAANVEGIRVEMEDNGFTKARVWIDPGDPLGSSAVEAPVRIWNKGLNPLIVCPAEGEIIVQVSSLQDNTGPIEVSVQTALPVLP